MRRIAVLIVSAAINASTIPAVAAEHTSNKDIDAARAVTVQSQPVNAADNEKTCRAYTASFYESVMLRQAAAKRVDGERVLVALDSVINAFNDLLASKCGGELHQSLANGNPRGAQMILFPLMTAWMWFQILKASPNLAFVPHRRERKQRKDLLAGPI